MCAACFYAPLKRRSRNGEIVSPVRHGVMDRQTGSLKLFTSYADACKAADSVDLQLTRLLF
jgi:hypothetical protein